MHTNNDNEDNMNYNFPIDIEYELEQKNIEIKMKNGLNFLYINTQSFRNKLTCLEKFLAGLKIIVHIIVLVEINLKTSEMKFYNLNNYFCYHSCREGKTYGGVAIYAHKSVDSQQVSSKQMCYANFLVVELIHLKCKIIGIYNPPDTNKTEFIDYLDGFLNEKQHSYIFGDFNINLLDTDSVTVSDFCSSINSNGFTFLNKISPEMYTRRSNTINTLIDHVITDKLLHSYILHTGDIYFSDHRFLLLNCNQNIPKTINKKIEKINYSALKSKISSINLENIDFETYHNTICETIKTCTETKIITEKFGSYNQPWFKNELKPYMKLRDEYYKLKKKFPLNDHFKLKFKYYKNFCADHVERDKIIFNSNKIQSNINQPRKLWPEISRIIYNKTKTFDNPVKLIKDNDQLISNPKLIANTMNNFFVEIPKQLDQALPNLVATSNILQNAEPSDCLTDFLRVSKAEIIEVIKTLKPDAAAGYDKLSTNFLRQADDKVLEFLVKSVNTMFDTNKFPNTLKIAKIIPIFKDGDKREANNYRPIAVLPILSKIFETIINNRIIEYLTKSNIIHKNQFGFRKGSSTAAATINLIIDIVNGLENKKKTAGLFIDLKKAFDCVNHEILLKHLWKIGFRGKAHKLLENYLTGRRQFVKIGETEGETIQNNCGVPQGSILGPTLFLIYINEIFNLQLIGKPQLYADDAVLIYTENSLDDLYVAMSTDLRILNSWFTENRLTINSKKTQYMIFKTKNFSNANFFNYITFNNEQIHITENYKYLGLWLDSNLNFNFHISQIKKRVAPIAGVLKKIRKHLTPNILDTIYFAYVHSHITYLISLWGMAGATKIHLLEVIQNKALKNLRGLPRLFPTKQLYNERILPLVCLQDYEMLLIAYKITKNNFKFGPLTYRSDIHSYNTRNAQNIHLPQFRLSIGRKSFSYDAFKKFNDLPNEIKQTESYSKFKNYIKNYLYENYSNN
jgi:exonuclease III